MLLLNEYAPIAGKNEVDEICMIADKLRGTRIVNINSTSVGGGVAEILSRMVLLMRDLGLDVKWEVIKGGDKFFAVTKKFHNALHGKKETFEREEFQTYMDTVESNVPDLSLDSDVVFVHDPQPAALVRHRREYDNRWVWRCHIDLSERSDDVWDFLRPFVEDYDACAFSSPTFSQKLTCKQVLIAPSIDPLSDKNKFLPQKTVYETLAQFKIDPEKPIVTQVSRYDYLKDPSGVIDAYRMVKPYVDCQLVLAGGSATDDPEGAKVMAEVLEKAADDPDIHVLCLPPTSNLEINALQRGSTVILQKSLKEGFGLTVSEGLWKAKPVIASAVGGIPYQIAHKYSGILTHSIEGTAFWLKQLLQSPDYAKKLGENGREHVRQNFLLTRHIRDYILLFLSLRHADKDIVYL